MHKLTDDETRILVHLMLQKIPKSALQDMQRGSDEARRRGLDAATRIFTGHLKLSRHDLYRPETKKGPLFG
jgi:hypothetical protein